MLAILGIVEFVYPITKLSLRKHVVHRKNSCKSEIHYSVRTYFLGLPRLLRLFVGNAFLFPSYLDTSFLLMICIFGIGTPS